MVSMKIYLTNNKNKNRNEDNKNKNPMTNARR